MGGHFLQPWRSQGAGSCDKCHCEVPDGEWVMDCRQCNWYLCELCHPQERERDRSFWNAIASALDTAAQDVSHMRSDLNTEIGAILNMVTCHAPDKNDELLAEIEVIKPKKEKENKNSSPTGLVDGRSADNIESENESLDSHAVASNEDVETEPMATKNLIEFEPDDLVDLSNPESAPAQANNLIDIDIFDDAPFAEDLTGNTFGSPSPPLS